MRTTRTQNGDRWDLIAYDLLGDAGLAPAVQSANPELVKQYPDKLPEGIEIVLPEINTEAVKISKTRAPWKQ